MLSKTYPIPCFLLWLGWRTSLVHASYCLMLWGWIFGTSSRKLQKRFYFCWTRCHPCCAAQHEAVEGKDRRWVAAAQADWQALRPTKPSTAGEAGWWWDSPACYGICSHSGGVKTGHETKDVCQLPCGEERTLLFPLGFLSLWISLPANDFLGHVILAWSKSVMEC